MLERLICCKPAYLAVLKDLIIPSATVTSATLEKLAQRRNSKKEQRKDYLFPSQFWVVGMRV